MRRGLLLALPFFAGFGAFMFCYALLVQEGLHASALTAGLGLVPMAAAFLLASLSTSRLLARFGAKVLAAGGLLQAVGLIILGITVYLGWPHLSVVDLAPGLAVAGLGQGLVMSPLFGVVLSEVPPAVAGAGSGVLTTTQQTALALGVATLGSLFLALAGDGTGVSTAFIVVLASPGRGRGGVAAGARGLPGWRRSQPGAGSRQQSWRPSLRRGRNSERATLERRHRAGRGTRASSGDCRRRAQPHEALAGQGKRRAGRIDEPVTAVGCRELRQLAADPRLRAVRPGQDRRRRRRWRRARRRPAAGRRRPGRPTPRCARPRVPLEHGGRVGVLGLDPGRRRAGRRVRPWPVPVAAANRDRGRIPGLPPAERHCPPQCRASSSARPRAAAAAASSARSS